MQKKNSQLQNIRVKNKIKSHRPVRSNTMEGGFTDKLMNYSEQKYTLQNDYIYNDKVNHKPPFRKLSGAKKRKKFCVF